MESPAPTKDATQLAQNLSSFTAWMERERRVKGKSQESLQGGNQALYNDAGSLRFTGSLFDYCLVQGADSWERTTPQSTVTVSGMIAPL